MAKELQEKINLFIQSVGSSPAQKSKEWYSLKSRTIGGSEVATVLGLNPYRNIKTLIAEKVGILDKPFNGNIATRWGNIFESITKDWAQNVLLMEECIKETGSLEGVINGQRYSPDGIGVVQLINNNDTLDYYIVLFEFKAPLRSLPDGKIPKHYMPQIQTGMMTIPIIELSIFVNNCYRKCPLANIGFDLNYDLIFHDSDLIKSRTKKQKFEAVLACGIICFYQTKENYELAIKLCGYGSDSESETDDFNEILNDSTTTSNADNYYDIDILMGSRESIIDFGSARYKMLDRLLELCDEKRIQIMYYPMILNQEAINELEFIQIHQKTKNPIKVYPKRLIKAQIEQFISHCDDHEFYPIGYLPWKLLKSDIIAEVPDPNWKNYIEAPILDTLQKIEEITNAPDPKAKYFELYPEVSDDVEVHIIEDDFMKKTD
jgi:hypothetical protein